MPKQKVISVDEYERRPWNAGRLQNLDDRRRVKEEGTASSSKSAKVERVELAEKVETNNDGKCFTKFDEVFSDWLAEHGLDASAENEALFFKHYARKIYSSASSWKRRRINDDADDVSCY